MRPNYTVGIDRAGTRVNTVFVAAREHLRTIVVNETLGLAADLVWVAKILWRTDTSGLVVAHLANSINATLFIRTRILTLSVDTGLGQGTLKVALTSRFYARYIGVALQWWRAHAQRSVIGHTADGGCSTLLRNARVAAFLSNTGQLKWTFWIDCAFRLGRFSDRCADLERISLIARRAETGGPVDPNLTDSVHTTVVLIHARVAAFL